MQTNNRIRTIGGGSGPNVAQRKRIRFHRHLILGCFGLLFIGYAFVVLSFLKVSNEKQQSSSDKKTIIERFRFNNSGKVMNDSNAKKLPPSEFAKMNKPEVIQPQSETKKQQQQKEQRFSQSKPTSQNVNQQTIKSTFEEWKKYAGNLALKLPREILNLLETEDPFGVRHFEKLLQEKESVEKRILNTTEIAELFPCPGSNGKQQQEERITIPDQRDHIKALKFRNGTRGYFLFFQHLRKAGGTNFCGLAQRNLPVSQVPAYYCMPDTNWEGSNSCAGCMSKYTNDVISTNMNMSDHRILGNEWDPFVSTQYFDLPAVFTTSFRKPLDRALSQFRFECMEERGGCNTHNVTQYWTKRIDLMNLYVWTFSNQRRIRWFTRGTDEEAAKARQNAVLEAMDTISKLNLVLVMEWLAYSPHHVRDVLGFKDTSTMTTRIRPHLRQGKREDGQEHNDLGSAGIAKASWTPKEYLTKDEYQLLSEDLALDEILTDAARRMFLERIVCDDMKEHVLL